MKKLFCILMLLVPSHARALGCGSVKTFVTEVIPC
jgi:hypothetical protein